MHDFPLSIAQVSEHASPLANDIGSVDSGGQNIYVRALALALGTAGHRVTVYTRRTAASQPERVQLAPAVDVVHVSAGPARQLPKHELAPFMGDFGDQLAVHWRDDPPDIVHAHYWMSGIAALAGARRTEIPVIATFHALGLERVRSLRGRPFCGQHRERERERERVGSERAVAQVTDALIALSHDEVSYLTGPDFGIAPAKIIVIPVGVDLAMFTPAGPALPRNGTTTRIVTVSRLVERKGIRALIESVPPGCELVIAGGPAPDEVDTDRAVRMLRQHARDHGTSTQVHFLGRLAHDQIPALLRSADIFATAPYYEPFGTAALEAAACGIPVVATPVGGLREHVHDNITGRLADPAGLRHTLDALLQDPAQRARLGHTAAQHATRYAWPAITAEILAVYHSTITESRTQT